MKNRIFSLGVIALSFAACSVNEMDIATPADKEAEEFFATIEDASTKVFVDDELMVLWHADDRVSIFNKYTYNQQYRFTGNTGANSGSFTKVPNDDFITGNALNFVYAIYPYKESTEISNQGVLTIDLPATQSYAENSFGIGANTMISCSEGNELLFKNLCGYIMLKLYGDNVTVKSISIKGNNDEALAGKVTVKTSVDSVPSMAFDASAAKEITLSFDTPVTLGTTAESATTFWLVVPPTTFSKGITLTVKDDKNGEFKKSSTASLQISRNTLKRLSTIQVISEPSDDVIVFADENVKAKLVAAFDANEDGELSYAEAAKVTSLDGVFGTTKTYSSFDEFQYFTSVTMVSRSLFEGWLLTSIKLPDSIRSIQSAAFKDCSLLSSVNIPSSVEKLSQDVFYGCSRLSSIIIPNTITEIGNSAFYNCESLTTLDIPESVSTIGAYAFWGCKSLTSINIPESITSISAGTFRHCSSLTSILLPESVTSIGLGAFANCSNLSSINIPRGVYRLEQEIFSHCSSLTNVVIPDWVTIIGPTAFYDCKNLTTLTLSESVSRIGDDAFMSCTSLTSITVKSKTPPIGGSDMFYRTNNCPIYVPAESVEAYKSAQFWSAYADRIQAIPDFFFNGKPLAKEDENVYSGIVSLQKNEVIKLDGDIQLSSFWLDPDFVVNRCFNAVNGLYRVTLNKDDQTIMFRRVNADGSAPNLSEGGLYLQGWGVAAKKMTEQIGWPGQGGYQLAQVSEGVFQFTGKAVKENATIIGGRYRYDYVSFKYFFQDGWGGECSLGIAIEGNACHLLEQDEVGGIHNLVETGACLEEGATYRLTIDFTNASISGNSITNGVENVRFEKLQ